MRDPLPAERLMKVSELFGAFCKAVSEDALTQGKDAANRRAVVLKHLLAAAIEAGPDAVKMLIDRLSGSAGSYQKMADEFMLQAMWCEEAIGSAQKELLAWMEEHEHAELKGDAWIAKLIEASEMTIDRKKLMTEGTKFHVQMPMIDEAKIQAAIKAGEEIPGITITKAKALQFVNHKRGEGMKNDAAN